MAGKFYHNMLLAFMYVHTNLPVKLKTNLNETKTKLQQKQKKSSFLQFKLLPSRKVAISQHPHILYQVCKSHRHQNVTSEVYNTLANVVNVINQ